MRLKRDARILKEKAIASLIGATAAFNSPHDRGRPTQVLLQLQHAFEMLLKAALVQFGVKVFDRRSGRSKGFEACVRLAESTDQVGLTAEDAGTLRAIDALRDDEQHWYNEVSEQLLYLHARAAITGSSDFRWGSRLESSGDEEHAEAVVGQVAVAAGHVYHAGHEEAQHGISSRR